MATHLKIGDNAPAFEAPDQNGETKRLSDYAGKKLILYFYPKDNTPGCTAEACSLRDGKAVLQEKGFEIVGVSPDTVQSHQRFIAKKELNFTLLSDPEHRVAEAYGVWGEKKFMGRVSMGILRTTFVIGAEKKKEKVFEKVRTADHFQQILEAYE